tara:strand:- start:181 stop:384 length:204 start_codon:yes stop_codon:yes gene_type:complete
VPETMHFMAPAYFKKALTLCCWLQVNMVAVRALSTFFFSSIIANIKVNNINADPIIIAISAINVIST